MEKTLSIGLIAAPELPAKIVKKYIDKLPEIFARNIDKDISWDVNMITDPLTGAAEDVDEILDKAVSIRKEEGWDYALCLTDLPIFYGKHVVAADNSFQERVAQISIPAFGWLTLEGSIKNAIVHILKELHIYSDRDKNPRHRDPEKFRSQLEKEFPIFTVKRIRPSRHPEGADYRYLVSPNINGKIRLLIGMIHSNRPMSIMGSFKKVLAVAFTTGAFGLIFPTLWNLGVILSTGRLIGLMSAAVIVMTTWIIIAHNLWELPSTRSERNLRHLYNMTTFFTLLISVITYYVLLLTFFFIASIVLIPPEYLGESLYVERNIGVVHYLMIAWVASSISTIAGAIGASMENEEIVRDITYGYRQKRRYNWIQDQE